jgi:hypothetical protein
MPDNERSGLSEVAFPLKLGSLDSVYEKDVRHVHLSTLHICHPRRSAGFAGVGQRFCHISGQTQEAVGEASLCHP